jgi:hypothetical protein
MQAVAFFSLELQYMQVALASIPSNPALAAASNFVSRRWPAGARPNALDAIATRGIMEYMSNRNGKIEGQAIESRGCPGPGPVHFSHSLALASGN